MRNTAYAVCSIFTLNDIIEIAKLDSLFDILDQDPEIEESFFDKIPLYKIKNPPTGMMKTTQSLTKVQNFMIKKGTEIIQSSGIETLRHKAETLSSLMDEATTFENVQGKPKKQNKFAFWGLAQCYEILLRDIVPN